MFLSNAKVGKYVTILSKATGEAKEVKLVRKNGAGAKYDEFAVRGSSGSTVWRDSLRRRYHE